MIVKAIACHASDSLRTWIPDGRIGCPRTRHEMNSGEIEHSVFHERPWYLSTGGTVHVPCRPDGAGEPLRGPPSPATGREPGPPAEPPQPYYRTG